VLRPSRGWSLWIGALLLEIWSLGGFGERLFGEVIAPSSAHIGLDSSILVAAMVAYESVGGLDHPTRRRIYDHLLALPGDHFRSIARSLDLGMGVARHHLDVLLSRDLVYADKSSGRVRYYVKTPSAQIEMNDLYAKHWTLRDTRQRILRVVQTMDVATPTKVAGMMGISRQLAAYHLAQLEKAGVLRYEKRGYRLRPAAPIRAGPDK
jgi:predicted transcriptional regulator